MDAGYFGMVIVEIAITIIVVLAIIPSPKNKRN